MKRAKESLIILDDGKTLQNGYVSGLRSLLLHCHEIRGVVSGTCEGNKMISEEDAETTTEKLRRRPPVHREKRVRPPKILQTGASWIPIAATDETPSWSEAMKEAILQVEFLFSSQDLIVLIL